MSEKIPLDRDNLQDFMKLSREVEAALQALPYAAAKDAIFKLDEMRLLISEGLPGHEYAECEHCEGGFGIDEMTANEDGANFCKTCVEKWQAP